MNDELFSTVIKSTQILQQRFGDDWNSSFFRLWTIYTFQVAGADSRQSFRHLDTQQFAPVIRFLMSLKYIGGASVMDLMYGTPSKRESGKSHWIPSNNFPILSKRTLDSFTEPGMYVQ